MKQISISLYLLIIFSAVDLKSQNLLDIIDQTEKAVFESRSFDKEGRPLSSASGFFISPNGLAITMSSIFEHADSAEVVLRNGKDYRIERIISTHPYSNLALIKVAPNRQKKFTYLIPSKQSYKENEELLTFSVPSDEEDGTTLATVNQIKHFPYVSRTGVLNASTGVKSNGAPAINYKGELTGIINGHPKKIKKIIYNSYLLNDSNWIDINIKVEHVASTPEVRDLFSPELSQGIYEVLIEDYIEAAREFSRHLKLIKEEAEGYCLRAYARYMYNNKVGSREDFNNCYRLDPDYYLQYHMKGMFALQEKKKADAQINFELCLDKQANYAPAIVQLALLNLDKRNGIQGAYNRFSEAILHDSLEATAYYERSRLRFKYSDNKKGMLEDVNKTIYLDPNLSGIYTIRGILRSSNKDMLGAIEDYDVAIFKDPGDVHAYFNRGIANYNIGLQEEACKDWEKAGELGDYKAYKYISRYCKKNQKRIYPN